MRSFFFFLTMVANVLTSSVLLNPGKNPYKYDPTYGAIDCAK